MQFEKWEGTRNDFVIVDRRGQGPVDTSLAIAMCDRRAGIGADGVLSVLDGDAGIARMHVTNADGSVPEMCGNGLRCVALWIVAKLDVDASFVVDTGRGALAIKHEGDLVEVDMGPATIEETLEVLHGARATRVSTGNPHLVVEHAVDRDGALELGPQLQSRYPANIGFVRADPQKKTLDLVVYERGAGLTEACGTGACAAVAALVHHGVVARDQEVSVRLPGGTLFIRAEAERVMMRGPARHVFSGTWSAI